MSRQSPPIVACTVEVATTGVVSPLSGVDINEVANLTPLSIIPKNWALQVTGLTAANALATPTSWDVIIQPSLDGLGFNDMTAPFLEHVNTANASGDVVFPKIANTAFFPLRFYKIDVKALSLGATATKIRITLLGVE